MNVLELFSGTGSVGKVCKELGWNVISVDRDLPATHKVDIMDFDYKQYAKNHFDVVWGSPPCTEYSRLQDTWIGRVRKGKLYNKEQQEIEMKEADKLVLKTLEIIDYFKPHYYFIENPLGRLKDRDIMKDIPYHIVDYCRYCDWGYKKRTCIWTNKKEFIPLTCDMKNNCGNMIYFNDKLLHKTNLGSNDFAEDNGVMIPINTKALREKYKGKIIRGKRKGTTLHEKYRIPPDLIYSLFLD